MSELMAGVAEKIEELRKTSLAFPPNIRRKVNMALSGIEQAIAATLGGGTLTAEQVRHTMRGRHCKLRMILDVDGLSIPQVMFDWQAIADELNAALGSGECESRWHELFGTPERAARTLERILCEPGHCEDCMLWKSDGDTCNGGDYDELLEWLRGNGE